jgi:hypothetical protein
MGDATGVDQAAVDLAEGDSADDLATGIRISMSEQWVEMCHESDKTRTVWAPKALPNLPAHFKPCE